MDELKYLLILSKMKQNAEILNGKAKPSTSGSSNHSSSHDDASKPMRGMVRLLPSEENTRRVLFSTNSKHGK